MSNETVEVPVALLHELRAGIRHRSNDGWLEEAEIVGPSVRELLALLPAPRPKVGDELTATQIKALPTHSVLRDADGDIYVKRADDYLVSIQSGGGTTDVEYAVPLDDPTRYDATLVWIPEEAA